jgi:hypothetical protein
MGVVAIGDAAGRMAENLDRRHGDVLVIVRRTRLAKVLQLPRLSGLNVSERVASSEEKEAEVMR